MQTDSGARMTRLFVVVATALMLCACEINPKPTPDPNADLANAEEPKQIALPSAAPLTNATENDLRYAQHTLKTIGFNVGQVDGIWGPRSAQAIRQFEQKFGLLSASGFLSELNLFMLEKISNTSRELTPTVPTKTASRGIAAKLDRSSPLAGKPQLVLLDQPQRMLAKPNPFSEQLSVLAPGTGIYVISEQEGWYEVESENKQHGFIKAD